MKLREKILVGLVAIAFVGVAVFGYTQTQFNEMYDILFRPQNPQIRVSGTAEVRDIAGTASGKLSMSVPATVGTAATDTLTIADCGSIIIGNATSGTQVYTLPAVSNTGCAVTFLAGHAGGEILVNSATGDDDCIMTSFAAVGTDADTGIVTDTSCTTGLKNTAGTNAIGDTMTLVSDGSRWLGVGITAGIWTTQ